MLSPTVISLSPLPSAHPAMAGTVAAPPVAGVLAERVERLRPERPVVLTAAA
jgi:hypothetical protein